MNTFSEISVGPEKFERKGNMRRDIKIKRWIETLGAIMTLVGLGGLGGAAEGEGLPIVATLTFAIGFAIVLWGYKR